MMLMKKGGNRQNSANISLEKVIGVTSRGNNSIAVNPINQEIAYTAAGVIVFYNPQTNKQTAHIFNTNSRVFSCLAFSRDGRYLATGEGTCRQPEIVIWEIGMTPKAVKQLKGHKYSIDWLCFSPDGQHLVSVGSEHDKGMFVWNWNSEKRLTSNKVTKRILSIAFAPSGEFFVTAGVKSIKMWNFDRGHPVTTQSSASAEVKCMASRNIDLAEMKDKTFTSVTLNEKNIFGMTQDGVLCVFTYERVMDRWMDLHADAGYTLYCSGNLLVCGCSEGIIRCFDASTLEHFVTLPRPPPLGHANISPDKKRQVIATDSNSTFADNLGLLLFSNNTRLFSVYSDRTVFVWDISKLNSVSVFRASLNHSGPINDIQILPSSTLELTQFVTGSGDKTIRFWNICHVSPKELQGKYIRNIYSKDLSRILYVSKSMNHFKASVSAFDEEGSIKCLKCSPCGKYVASGDATGVLRVHQIETLDEALQIQAHDSDILCMDYTGSEPAEGKSPNTLGTLLATGSRDRLIHIFDADNNFKPVTTIDDHSSSISDLCFVKCDGVQRLVSCGADKAIIYRNLNGNSVTRYYQSLQKKKIYSINSHPIHKNLVSGEEKAVKLWDLDTGKASKTYDSYQEKSAPKSASDGNTKVVLDYSGMIICAVNLDKNVRLIDYYSGKLLAKVNSGENTTCAAFSPNGRNLLTATADGCVFVWKVASELSRAIRARLEHANLPLKRSIEAHPWEGLNQFEKPKEEPPIKYHNSIMPVWAKSIKPGNPENPEKPPEENPFEINVEDIVSSKEGPIGLSKKEIPGLEVESEEEKEEEKKQENIVLAERPREKPFTLNTSVVGMKPSEVQNSPRDEEFYDAEEELEEEKLPELEPDSTYKANPLRSSLSSSYWKKKQEKSEEKPLFFEYEQVESEPWHVPKVDPKKEKHNVKNEIDDVKKMLKGIGVLESNPDSNWLKKRRRENAWEKRKHKEDDEPQEPEESEEIKEDIQQESDEIKEDIQQESAEISEEIEEELQQPEEPQQPQKKFDSPYTAEAPETQSFSETDFEVSQSMQSMSLSKDQYKQGFLELKQSLQNVKQFFDQIDPSDPEYSVSLEESNQEVDEIQGLLKEISRSLGGNLETSQNSQDTLLERYSEKLVSMFHDKLRQRMRD